MFPSVGKLGNIFARNSRWHTFFVTDLPAVLRMLNREIYVSRAGNIIGNMWANIVCATKMFLNLFGNTVAFVKYALTQSQ